MRVVGKCVKHWGFNVAKVITGVVRKNTLKIRVVVNKTYPTRILIHC